VTAIYLEGGVSFIAEISLLQPLKAPISFQLGIRCDQAIKKLWDVVGLGLTVRPEKLPDKRQRLDRMVFRRLGR
jgi:hypothetical protein